MRLEARPFPVSFVLIHEDGCPCERCEAVREFNDAPTVEIPLETMYQLVNGSRG